LNKTISFVLDLLVYVVMVVFLFIIRYNWNFYCLFKYFILYNCGY